MRGVLGELQQSSWGWRQLPQPGGAGVRSGLNTGRLPNLTLRGCLNSCLGTLDDKQVVTLQAPSELNKLWQRRRREKQAGYKYSVTQARCCIESTAGASGPVCCPGEASSSREGLGHPKVSHLPLSLPGQIWGLTPCPV